MRISDSIESFIKNMLGEDSDEVELKRNELAEYFGCAPSQINYVLATRFSPSQGYLTGGQPQRGAGPADHCLPAGERHGFAGGGGPDERGAEPEGAGGAAEPGNEGHAQGADHEVHDPDAGQQGKQIGGFGREREKAGTGQKPGRGTEAALKRNASEEREETHAVRRMPPE